MQPAASVRVCLVVLHWFEGCVLLSGDERGREYRLVSLHYMYCIPAYLLLGQPSDYIDRVRRLVLLKLENASARKRHCVRCDWAPRLC